MKPAAVLFDLDGTLLDTEALILDSFRFACDSVLGYRVADEELLALVGIPLFNQMEMLAPGHAEEMTRVYRENNALHHDRLVCAFPGTEKALQQLTDAGLSLAVVTSKRNDFAQRGLDFFGFGHFFEFLIGSDDTMTHKPEPEPLLLAARRLNLAPESCAYVGDSPYDMQAACAAKMCAIGAEWGMFNAEQLLQAGAEVLVSDISELVNILEV